MLLKAKFTPAVSSVQSLTPPPPLSLSLSLCDQIREKESLPLNTTIRASKRKFAKSGHQVQVSRAPTASMQWLIQKKKMQSFFRQRQAVFMHGVLWISNDLRRVAALGNYKLSDATFNLFTPCDIFMILDVLERFSKPNFGSIRGFRTMTGLEIENWIEKRGRTIRKFRSTRPRTESNFRFGLTSCRSQNLPTEVQSLLCQVFDSFSLVTSSSSHHASYLWGFIRSLTRPNWSFHSTRLTMNFFTSAGDFRQIHGHHQFLLLLLLFFIGKPQQAFKASLQGARDISW